MKARLNQLLDVEHLSPSKFADHIGVQRSSVSHVLSGRNNPSFDFLSKTLKAFPDLNADWLILGQGAMYDRGDRSEGTLFQSEQQEISSGELLDSQEKDLFQESKAADAPEMVVPGNIQRENKFPKVVRVVLFYDDDTFRSYEPED